MMNKKWLPFCQLIPTFLIFFKLAHCSPQSSRTPPSPQLRKCGELYSEDNFGGAKYPLADQQQALNLAEEIHDSAPEGWNKTGSARVAAGCMMQICNEKYYDGTCKRLVPGQYNAAVLSANVGDRIGSAGCSCKKECQCSNIFMKKSTCARAYLEGGCRRCNNAYADLTGSSKVFPNPFVGKVEAFRLRKGCRLTIYPDENHGGTPQIITNEIVEGFKGSFRSYNCECNDRAYVPRTPPSRPNFFPPLVEVPQSVNEIVTMLKHPKFMEHPGLRAALKSRNKKRSLKNAYILLLGTTGSGKSSAVNLLFDNPNITTVGDYVSTTTDIHEFRINVPIDEWGLSNTELRVIDTPGLGDTRGLEQDAKFLANLDNYLANHEELKDRLPNAVLIFHKFNDNRIIGEGSPYVKMIRGFDAFRKRITDDSYSNVIHVLTHFCSATTQEQRRPAERIRKFKEVIEEYSLLPRPTIITVAENKGNLYQLPMVNGYYRLPNNEYYPRNLFEKLELITKNGEDEIGRGVFRAAFKNSDDFHINARSFKLVDTTGEKVQRYLHILQNANFGIPNNEISQILLQAWDTKVPTELKRMYPASLAYLQKALNMLHINSRSDVPTSPTALLQLLTSIKQDPATRTLLRVALNLTAPKFPMIPIAGFGYNLVNDSPLAKSPYNVSSLSQTDIGFTIPSFLTCKLEQSSAQTFHIVDDPAHYIQHRLHSLGLQGEIATGTFKGKLKPGYNIKSLLFKNGSSSGGLLSATREIKRFTFNLNQRADLHQGFVNAVKALPAVNREDANSMAKWNEFFGMYGTHVVQSVHGGGSIEVKIRPNNKGAFDRNTVEALLDLIKFADDMTLVAGINQKGGNGNNRTVLKAGVQHELLFSGGNPQYHAKDLTKLSIDDAANVMNSWKNSLKFAPAMLTAEMRLLPMSQVVKSLGRNFSEQMDKATSILFNSTLNSVPQIQMVPIAKGITAPGPSRSETPMMSKLLMEMAESNRQIDQMLENFRKGTQTAEITRTSNSNSVGTISSVTTTRRPIMYSITSPKPSPPQPIMYSFTTTNKPANPVMMPQYYPPVGQPAPQYYPPAPQYIITQQPQWLTQILDPRHGVVAQGTSLIKDIIKIKPAGRGASCLKEGTKILMGDGTKKSVETLQVGDIVVDMDMKPTTVLGVAHEFLLDQTFYGFDNSTFFFTNSHLFVGPKDEGTSNSSDFNLYAKSTENLYHNNPLLEYLNVRDMPESKSFKLFHVNETFPETMPILVKDVVVTKDSQSYPSDTPIHFIQVDSPTGTYFANGYVCRHEVPPVEHWPNTMSILFKLMETKSFEKLAELPYTFKTVSHLQNANKEVAEIVERFLKSKEGKWNSTEGERKYEVMTLSDINMDVCISKIFSDSTLSTAGVNFYAQVGRAIAKYLDNPELENMMTPVSLGKIQYELYQMLHDEIRKFVNYESSYI